MRYVIASAVFTFIVLIAIKSGAVPVWFRTCRACRHEFATRAGFRRHMKGAHHSE